MTHTEILEKLGTAVKKGLGIDESVLERSRKPCSRRTSARRPPPP
jgi:hypothetical protein